MKNSMRLVISDNEVSLVQMARAKELHDRKGEFQNLQVQGHVRLLTTEDPERIHVQIEDEVIPDDREHFPTTLLMAKLQLAIAAGRSCRNNADLSYDAVVSTFGMEQIDRYQQAFNRIDRRVGKSKVLAMGYGDAHIAKIVDEKWDIDEPFVKPKQAVKRLTATVKNKFAKGLRP